MAAVVAQRCSAISIRSRTRRRKGSTSRGAGTAMKSSKSGSGHGRWSPCLVYRPERRLISIRRKRTQFWEKCGNIWSWQRRGVYNVIPVVVDRQLILRLACNLMTQAGAILYDPKSIAVKRDMLGELILALRTSGHPPGTSAALSSGKFFARPSRSSTVERPRPAGLAPSDGMRCGSSTSRTEITVR